MGESILTEMGTRLRDSRYRLGYKADEFANMLEVSTKNYLKYESGKVRMSLEGLHILSKVGVDPHHVICGPQSMESTIRNLWENSDAISRESFQRQVSDLIRELPEKNKRERRVR